MGLQCSQEKSVFSQNIIIFPVGLRIYCYKIHNYHVGIYVFQVSKENRRLYLSSICMRCLEAFAPGTRIRCVYCSTPFDGGSMVLGTMYLYDVFAAQPCCQDRVRVSVLLILPNFLRQLVREAYEKKT